MYVEIDASILAELGNDILSFEDHQNCTGHIIGNNIVFQTGFHDCGTTREVRPYAMHFKDMEMSLVSYIIEFRYIILESQCKTIR